MWKIASLFVIILALVFSACAPLQVPEETQEPDARATDNSPDPSAPEDSLLLTAGGDSQQVVIHWQRSGGFAGICQEMDVFADGHAVVTDCESNRVLASGDLPDQNRQLLKNWLEEYQEFSWKFNPPKNSADMFLDEFTFTGIGDQIPSEQDQENVNQELAELAQTLLQQPSS